MLFGILFSPTVFLEKLRRVPKIIELSKEPGNERFGMRSDFEKKIMKKY